MIPIKLQIKNFLSYGSELQTIDFEPYNLICLSGKNGHGKSALLDAIAWAVWGQARKTTGTSKPDQGLLRLGQRQMIVIFDFEFNKNRYRIRREFTFAYGKPYAYLEFGMFAPEENIISLTDKTISATQEKIESMIGLSFDSFCNSAFLRQGSSNEFSKKSPKERKEILANILGLGKFENLRKIALDKAKLLLGQRETNLKLTDLIEKDLTVYDEVSNNLVAAQQEIETLSTEQAQLTQQKEVHEQEKQKISLSLMQLKKIEEEQKAGHKALYETYSLWQMAHCKKLNAPDTQKLEQEKKLLLNNIEILQQLQHKQLQYKEQLLKLKEEEQNILNKLHAEQAKELQQKQLDLQKLLIAKQNLQAQTVQGVKTSGEKVSEKFITNTEEQLEQRRNFYQQLIAQGNLIKSELSALSQKIKLTASDQDQNCPVCEQDLPAERKHILHEQFIKQEELLNKRIVNITAVIAKFKEILVGQHEQIKFYKLELQNFQVQDALNSLEPEILKAQSALEKFKLESAKLINRDSAQITDLVTKIAEIKYDPQEHKKLVTQIAQIDATLSVYSNVDITVLREQHKSEFLRIITKLRMLKTEVLSLQDKMSQFGDLKTLEQNINAKDNALTSGLKELARTKDIVLQKHGSLQNQKAKLEQLAQEYKKYKKEIDTLQESIDDYKIISTALSKDGIQALLIEDAIPEIENAANELLAKLTDNQSQIIIDSVRDLKKGGMKETLDIKISDAIGIRPYEMFSGGEAFRIDFALRIAISKLLAQRSGTSLQTLIIDEGFGSQDEEGLANIMDSIYKIQEDFAKIIIVSHLATMKEQFPVHFVVEKGPLGSAVKVLEQG